MLKRMLIVFLISSVFSKTCHQILTSTDPKANYTKTTCEGDFCVWWKFYESPRSTVYQTCYVDPNVPPIGCLTDINNNIICYCNTSFCNTNDILDHLPVTSLPITQCISYVGEVAKKTKANRCFYEYPVTDTAARRGGFSSVENTPLPPPTYPEFVALSVNFILFYDGCYNVTNFPDPWKIYCKCTANLCNENQPFDVVTGGVTCVAGHCLGQFFYVRETECNHFGNPETVVEKGCISAKEAGPYYLQSGKYKHLKSTWCVCRTNHCNENISTALAAAENEGQQPTTQAPEMTTQRCSNLNWNIICFILFFLCYQQTADEHV